MLVRSLPAVLLASIVALPRSASAQADAAGVQDTTSAPTNARTTTTAVPDRGAPAALDGTPAPRFTSGMGVGTVTFVGGRTERATSASLRLHLTSWLSTAVAPSLVVASQPGSTGVSVTQTGLADVPVEIAAERTFPLPLSPDIGLAFTTTVPVGDTASGLGAGRVGFAASTFLAIAPTSWLSFHGGAGRSLTDFSVQGTLNGSASGWGYGGATFGVANGFSLGADVDGDLGPADPTLGHSLSVAVGVGAPAGRLGSLSVDVMHGLTGPTPTWGCALRVGLDYAGLASAGARSPSQDMAQAFGAGPHGLTPPGNSGSTPAATNGHGRGTGTTSGSGTTTHGRSGH